jgi:tetratricopeptide (TPR) repeat protein
VHYFQKGQRRRTPPLEAPRVTAPERAAAVAPPSPRSASPVPGASSALTLPELELPWLDPAPQGPGKAGRAKRRTSGNFRRRTTEEFNVEATAPAPTVVELLGSENPLQLLRALTPGQLAEMAVAGHGLFEAGALESSRRVFELIVALQPRESFPFTMLGTVYLALELPDRALALFESALELDKGDVAARVYRGELRLRRGKLRHAVADLERAVEGADPQDPFIQRGRRLLQEARRALKARPVR